MISIPSKELKNGFKVPVFGLGTWLIGGGKTRDPENDDEGNKRGIKEAIELGITHIDTAENYAEGWAEKIVGKAVKGYDRKKLFITSKVGNNNLSYQDLVDACKRSLERLQTDYLDLYLIHSPNDSVPIEDSLRGMDKLVAEGLIKNVGLSNFKTQRLIEAQKITKQKIVTNQVYYNLVYREPEKESLLKYCQENDVILTAYRPIEKGILLKNIPPMIQELTKKYDKTPVQIMLNWLISQKNVITISKMIDIEHIKENLGSIGWEMEKKDVEMLRANYPGQSERSEHLPLK